MVPVGDVHDRDAREGGDQRVTSLIVEAPDRVAGAIVSDEVKEGRAAGRLVDDPIDPGRGVIDQEDRAGLGPKLDDVPGPVVLLVLAGPFVLADHVPLVLVDREAAGDPGLNVIAHPEAIDVQARLVLHEGGR